MSLQIFPFTLERPYSEVPIWPAEESDGSETGVKAIRALTAREVFTVPDAETHITDYKAYFDFWIAHKGKVKRFKFKAYYPVNFIVENTEIGIGDTVLTDFYLTHKYIDATALTVELDDIDQASGWSLVDNDIKPLIRFTSPPSGSVRVDVSYEFYVACRFTDTSAPNSQLVPGNSLSNQGIILQTVGLEEWGAGDRYAPA